MPQLSPEQLTILCGIAAALSEDEIAARLGRSPSEFQGEMSRLLQLVAGLDAESRLEVAEQVAQHQLDIIQSELGARAKPKKKK